MGSFERFLVKKAVFCFSFGKGEEWISRKDSAARLGEFSTTD
jgi:hypothetical protein